MEHFTFCQFELVKRLFSKAAIADVWGAANDVPLCLAHWLLSQVETMSLPMVKTSTLRLPKFENQAMLSVQAVAPVTIMF